MQVSDILDSLMDLCVLKQERPENDEFFEDEDIGWLAEPEEEEETLKEKEDDATMRTGKRSKKDNEAVKKFIRNLDLTEKPLCDEYERPEKEKQRMLHNLKADDIAMIIVKQKRLDSCQHKPVYKKVL